MENNNKLNWIANFIRGIADDVLRNRISYRVGRKYRTVAVEIDENLITRIPRSSAAG